MVNHHLRNNPTPAFKLELISSPITRFQESILLPFILTLTNGNNDYDHHISANSYVILHLFTDGSCIA